jgi:hypothetical protein
MLPKFIATSICAGNRMRKQRCRDTIQRVAKRAVLLEPYSHEICSVARVLFGHIVAKVPSLLTAGSTASRLLASSS